MKARLYKKGEFIEIEHPFEECFEKGNTFEGTIKEMGYETTPSVNLNIEFSFPNIEIFEQRIPPRESQYPFYGAISITTMIEDLFFENWVDLLHFLENYTGWIKNMVEIAKFNYERDVEMERRIRGWNEDN